MSRAELRRMRDRKFIPLEWKRHWKRAFAVVKAQEPSWDLFPPIKGYRPFSTARRTYNVSHQRQQRDWSNLIRKCQGDRCQKCNSPEMLEAHHIWPQGTFPHLRYLVTNGLILCRECHASAYSKPEITPNQFKMLTEAATHVNANIEAVNFWERYTAGLEKGRLIAFGIEIEEPGFHSSNMEEQLQWFKTWAKLNSFYEFVEEAATTKPFPDYHVKLNESFKLEVNKHDPFQ